MEVLEVMGLGSWIIDGSLGGGGDLEGGNGMKNDVNGVHMRYARYMLSISTIIQRRQKD